MSRALSPPEVGMAIRATPGGLSNVYELWVAGRPRRVVAVWISEDRRGGVVGCVGCASETFPDRADCSLARAVIGCEDCQARESLCPIDRALARLSLCRWDRTRS